MEDTAPNVYPEVFSKPHTPVHSNHSDEDVLEGYPNLNGVDVLHDVFRSLDLVSFDKTSS